jgi:hypothetical protein
MWGKKTSSIESWFPTFRHLLGLRCSPLAPGDSSALLPSVGKSCSGSIAGRSAILRASASGSRRDGLGLDHPIEFGAKPVFPQKTRQRGEKTMWKTICRSLNVSEYVYKLINFITCLKVLIWWFVTTHHKLAKKVLLCLTHDIASAIHSAL